VQERQLSSSPIAIEFKEESTGRGWEEGGKGKGGEKKKKKKDEAFEKLTSSPSPISVKKREAGTVLAVIYVPEMENVGRGQALH